jgi:hypothetical protein
MRGSAEDGPKVIKVVALLLLPLPWRRSDAEPREAPACRGFPFRWLGDRGVISPAEGASMLSLVAA